MMRVVIMSNQHQTQNSTLDQVLVKKSVHSKQIVDVKQKIVKLVIFCLADEWYAFYGHNIREILPKDTPVFFVPGCPKSLTGEINVRGEIESVINISMVLQLATNEQSGPQNIVLLAKSAMSKEMSSGISVNKVIDVVDVPERIIQSPPETLPDHIRPYVLSVLEFKGHAVTVLNLDQIFKDYQQGLEA